MEHRSRGAQRHQPPTHPRELANHDQLHQPSPWHQPNHGRPAGATARRSRHPPHLWRRTHLRAREARGGRVERGGRWPHQIALCQSPWPGARAKGLARQHLDLLPWQALRRRSQSPLGPTADHRNRWHPRRALAPARFSGKRFNPPEPSGPPRHDRQRSPGPAGRHWRGLGLPAPAPAPARSPRSRAPGLGRTAVPPRRSQPKPAPRLAGGGLAPGGIVTGADRGPRARWPAPAPGALPRGGAAAGAHPGGGP